MTPILWPADGQQELQHACRRNAGEESKAAHREPASLPEGAVPASTAAVDRDANGFVAVCAVLPLF